MDKLRVTAKYLEDCLKQIDPAVRVEVTVYESMHDEVPDGYTESSIALDTHSVYERIIDAKDGVKTKTITLYIPD